MVLLSGALDRDHHQQAEFWRRYGADPGDAEVIALIAAFWRSRWFQQAAPESAALGRSRRLRRPEWGRGLPRLVPSAAMREELDRLHSDLTPALERTWRRYEADRVMSALAWEVDPSRDEIQPLIQKLRAA